MTDEAPVHPEREAAQKAASWLEQWAKEAGYNLAEFTHAQWFMASMEVPCTIRCWRVGVPIEVAHNAECPECGKVNTWTMWDRLSGPDPL